MLQLNTKEFDIYKSYIFKKIAENFKHIGVIYTDYLKTVTNIEYEVSEITGLIYPSINFRDSFEKLETLSKIELIDKPDNLFDEYKIKTVKVPTLEVYKTIDYKEITPYDIHDNPQDYYNKYITDFSETEVLILTNDKETEYLFIDNVNNLKLYKLKTDYQKEKSFSIYKNISKIKNQIRNIVDTIKPIDAERLQELVIQYYKNV